MTATISRVDVFSVGMPLVGTFTSGGVSNNVTRCVVVRVTATDGAVGISSIDPSSKACVRTVRARTGQIIVASVSASTTYRRI